MLKTILVATDGSDHAKRAIKLAADMATKYDAKLLLLHVIDNQELSQGEKRLAAVEYPDVFNRHVMASDIMDIRALGPKGVEPLFDYHAETFRIIRTAIGENLMEAAQLDAKANGVNDVETIMEVGNPATVIIDIAKSRGADLIVVGSRGRSDLKALFLGSVSHKVANLADVNVITVK